MTRKCLGVLLILALFITSCTSKRRGDEIVVCGQRFHTGTPVVLWTDPGGYNGYSAPAGARFSQRAESLATLKQTVDQFVLHYDACGLSRVCFDVLSERNLSIHFMLDIDGTIYQTIDLKEQAWHATTSNPRSIGIEIANIGAYESPDAPELALVWQGSQRQDANHHSDQAW